METFFRSIGHAFAEKRTPLKTLQRLHDQKKPVRLEVENSELSFYTLVSAKPEFALLSKPPDLADASLAPGAMVRFTVPGGDRVVRLRVIHPSVQRKRGDNVMQCEIPLEFAEKSRRASQRFNTQRFKNIHLAIPQVGASLRIIDLSLTGCKTMASGLDPDHPLQVGAPMRFTKVHVGEKGELELDLLTPRLITEQTVSFEWLVAAAGSSAEYLQHLIEGLHRAELGRLKVKEKIY